MKRQQHWDMYYACAVCLCYFKCTFLFNSACIEKYIMDAIQNNASFSIVIVRRIYLFQKKKERKQKRKEKEL